MNTPQRYPEIGDIVTALNGGVRWTVRDRYRGADGIERMDLVSPRGTFRRGVPAGRMITATDSDAS
jgi:hypothetical protein